MMRTLPLFQPLTGIFEPSAVQQLPDGRFLVVEDEKQHPFSLFSIDPNGGVASRPLVPASPDADKDFWKLDDLEGLALDAAGLVYAVTSHSRNGDGEEKKSRHKLVRFRVEGDEVVRPQVVTGLKAALTSAHPVLAAAAEIRDVKADGGFNIEALEVGADRHRLLVGFRSPLLDNRAIVASIENVAAMFELGEPPRVASTLDTLDLDGNGIRGMSYVPALGGYLVVGGPVARQPVQFELWFWSGERGAAARRVSVAGLPGFEHAEGVSPAVIAGCQYIVIVSDDGSRVEGRYARFLLLEPSQLRIAR